MQADQDICPMFPCLGTNGNNFFQIEHVSEQLESGEKWIFLNVYNSRMENRRELRMVIMIQNKKNRGADFKNFALEER